jgi:hypothetical protein
MLLNVIHEEQVFVEKKLNNYYTQKNLWVFILVPNYSKIDYFFYKLCGIYISTSILMG